VPLRNLIANPSRVVLAVTLALAVVHFSGVLARGVRPRVIRGDALHYYVQLRSAVVDRDLDFENDYIGLFKLDFTVAAPPPGFTFNYEHTPNGHVRNFMPVGPALLWAPLFLAVGAVAWLLSAAGLAAPPDGFGLAFQLVPDVCGIAAAGLAVYFAFLLGRRLFCPRAALWSALAALLGTPLIYYATVSPSYSHTLSAMSASAFFLYWWHTRDRADLRRYAILGALAGLVALVRWQDGMVITTILVDVVVQARRQGRSAAGWVTFGVPRLAAAGLAALAAFSPQMIVWQVLYGQPLTIPQGGDFMRWTQSQMGAVLVSPYRGLFSWTPLTALAVAGLIGLRGPHRRLAWTLGLFFLVSTYINGAVADWWAGEAFGARRYMSCFPLFAVGAGYLLTRAGLAGAVARWTTAALVVANLFLLAHYEVFMIGLTRFAPYPGNSWYTLWVERFLVPVRLLRSALGW